MELNSKPFNYKGTGSSVFISILFVMVVYSLCIYMFVHGHMMVGGIIFIAFIAATPLMLVNSLQYQARMTSLNGMTFSFSCSMLRAWLCLFAVPLVIEVVLGVVLYALYYMTNGISGTMGILVRLVLLGVVGLIGLGIVNGICYGRWMDLMANGGCLGTHRFAMRVDMKQCIKGCVLALLTLLPFFVVIGYLAGPIFGQIVILSAMGDEVGKSALILENFNLITMSYLLYFVAIIVVVGYLYVTLRNQFLNNLTLADGALRFHSSVTGFGMVMRMVLVYAVSGCTCGLAYPWLKMYFVRWLANNTLVIGNLDALALTQDETSGKSGPLMWLSRGMMPHIPFI